ncbi:MAG: hypothetical protein LBJ02_12805 [Bifidobacteriaceae bacterium]|jgi:hypothetical protein|nr:hypothetical protein [Bifidobacteriaceae bacterium]
MRGVLEDFQAVFLGQVAALPSVEESRAVVDRELAGRRTESEDADLSEGA